MKIKFNTAMCKSFKDQKYVYQYLQFLIYVDNSLLKERKFLRPMNF